MARQRERSGRQTRWGSSWNVPSSRANNSPAPPELRWRTGSVLAARLVVARSLPAARFARLAHCPGSTYVAGSTINGRGLPSAPTLTPAIAKTRRAIYCNTVFPKATRCLRARARVSFWDPRSKLYNGMHRRNIYSFV